VGPQRGGHSEESPEDINGSITLRMAMTLNRENSVRKTTGLKKDHSLTGHNEDEGGLGKSDLLSHQQD